MLTALDIGHRYVADLMCCYEQPGRAGGLQALHDIAGESELAFYADRPEIEDVSRTAHGLLEPVIPELKTVRNPDGLASDSVDQIKVREIACRIFVGNSVCRLVLANTQGNRDYTVAENWVSMYAAASFAFRYPADIFAPGDLLCSLERPGLLTGPELNAQNIGGLLAIIRRQQELRSRNVSNANAHA